MTECLAHRSRVEKLKRTGVARHSDPVRARADANSLGFAHILNRMEPASIMDKQNIQSWLASWVPGFALITIPGRRMGRHKFTKAIIDSVALVLDCH
jgi:hypothetical protein